MLHNNSHFLILRMHLCFKTQSTVPSSKYMLSSFGIIKEIVELIGAVDAQLVDRYVEQLTAFGFETPQLLLGAKGEFQLLLDMKFKIGHALKFMKVLDQIVDDIDM